MGTMNEPIQAHIGESDAVDTGAPLVLVTGLPGAGKSLFALAQYGVDEKGQLRANTYQSGIPGCKLPYWDPVKWRDLPPGATYFIDEAQDVFPPRNPNSDPPSHYVFNRVRKGGLAVVLLTQHPTMIDARVRRLCGKHFHLVNEFGAESAMLHEFPTGVGDVDARNDSLATRWKYPKHVYDYYESASKHRGKGKPPARVRMIPWLIGGAVVAVLAGLWWTWHVMNDMPGAGVADKAKLQPVQSARPGSTDPRSGRTLTAAEYVASHQPRLPGLAHTAPRYDDLTKPSRAPFPAACVSTKARCKCFSQDATVLDVPEPTCRSVVERGFFKDWTDPMDRGRAVGPAGVGQREASAPARGNVASREDLVALADQTPPVGQALDDGQVLRSMRK